MTLTKPGCPGTHNPDDFPTVQLFLLAIVRLAEPIALTSIFPYAWPLVKRFHVGAEQDASLYAGLLVSAFSLAEALTGMFWGGLSDRVGRKPVLLLGCVGTLLSLLVVGLAPNIWVALAGRLVGGLLNGNIGVIQTMVGELVTKPEHEPRAYSVMPFVWSIGTIVGPCVGGTFADPHASWPALFPEGSLFHRLPYLLPNLVCAALLLASIVLGYFLLDETHPGLKAARAAELNRRANDVDPRHGELEVPRAAYVSGETPLHETSDALKRPAVDLRSQTYGTFGAQRHQQQQKQDEHDARHESCTQHLLRLTREKPQDADATKERANGIAFSRPILSLVVALSIFTAHSMAYDHLLPIFFEDARSPSTASTTFTASHSVFFLLPSGGLGLSLRAVGFIMAVNGAIALFVQAAVFPPLAACVGVKRLFLAVTLLHPLAYLVVPLLPLVPVGTASGAGSGEGLLYAAIYACLALRNLLSILLYPVLLILIKEAATATAGLHGSGNSSAALVIGRVNGLAASAGAACRMVAPPLFGWLYGVGARRAGCPAVAWWAAALLAGVGAVQGWWCVGRSWRRSGTANNRACGSSAGSDEEESVALLGDCNDGRAKALDDRDA